VLHAPTTLQVDLTYQLGSCSGRDGDKFARYGIATEPASLVSAPLVAGCAAWLECKVVREPDLSQRHDLFLLEAVAAWADDALWSNGNWHFTPTGPRTIHHEKGGAFFATGERFQALR
jgi:flavin reductase (DIM6/NTAB) family NADH-FMN oxidoreductase RutF